MRIDFHTHVFPDRIAHATIEKLSAVAGIKPQSDGTADGLLASMREASIDLSVILQVATHPGQVEKINTVSAEVNRRYAGKLFCTGAMHPEYGNYEDELKRIRDLGLKGIKIHPVYQEEDIDSDRFIRILRCAADLGMFVVTHAGYDIGYPGAVRCSPVMCRHVVEEIGSFPFILAHMGGWQNWDSVIEELKDLPVFIDTAFSFEPVHTLPGVEHPKMLDVRNAEDIILSFGADRVIFGSDSPWADQKEYIDLIERFSLSEEEKEKIFGGNAAKILQINKG